MANVPTFINLPPPPSDPATPSDMPGTPTSATTSMSELSTVAIKDGHRGHLPHHAHHTAQPVSGTLDAERADRISRLAGLERVTTARNLPPLNNLTPSAAAPAPGTSGYFDALGNSAFTRERSTVGSASATGSAGRTGTWASGSEAYDQDKMSESQDMDLDRDTGSIGGMSAEGTDNLVGFGEGARTPARQSAYSSPTVSKATPLASAFAPVGSRDASTTPVSTHAADEQHDASMLDGMAYDSGVGDTSGRMPGTRSRSSLSADTPEYDGQGLGGSVQGNSTSGRFDFDTK